MFIHVLTRKPLLMDAEKYMFGRFSEHDTTSGLTSCRDWQMNSWVSGDAVAVKAINGALVTARSPPSFVKAVLKSLPLRVSSMSLRSRHARVQAHVHVLLCCINCH